MESLQFEKKYRVHVYETGPDGRLNLYSLFNYFQDIASEHAVRLGFGRDDLMKTNRFWVLSRIYTEIAEWPLWEDTITIRTWPNGTDKLFALRNYEVTSHDGRVMASGISSWLILDLTTRKIQRPDQILAHFSPGTPRIESPVRNAMKLEPAADQGSESPPFKVRVSDLDVNLHSNNVQYLKWVCDTYTLDFVTNNYPVSAEINYLAESLFDDGIFIRTSEDKENGIFRNHSVIRINDNKELCRIRIGWKNAVNI
jgi:medium-chain acyl-[acyl-carrier-protein] hydrolase